MNKSHILKLLIFLFSILSLYACGNKPYEQPDETKLPPAQPKVAYIDISSQGTTSILIKSIDVTIVLPIGVTVKATPDASDPSVLVTNSGVVDVAGVAMTGNATAKGIYTAATSTVSGKLKVHVEDNTGFTTGNFVGILCDITEGTFPRTRDFSLIDFKAVDLNGADILGLSAKFTLST